MTKQASFRKHSRLSTWLNSLARIMITTKLRTITNQVDTRDIYRNVINTLSGWKEKSLTQSLGPSFRTLITNRVAWLTDWNQPQIPVLPSTSLNCPNIWQIRLPKNKLNKWKDCTRKSMMILLRKGLSRAISCSWRRGQTRIRNNKSETSLKISAPNMKCQGQITSLLTSTSLRRSIISRLRRRFLRRHNLKMFCHLLISWSSNSSEMQSLK